MLHIQVGRSKALRRLLWTSYQHQSAAGADSETIRAASTFAISDRDAFLEKVRSASQLRQAEAAKDAKRKLSKDKKRITELDTIIKKLYESFAVGRITDERFDSLLADYEAEQKRCKPLSQKRKKSCPLSQRIPPVWSCFWSWQGSTPTSLS